MITSVLFYSLRFDSLPFYLRLRSARDLLGLCVYKATVRLVGSLKLDLVNKLTRLCLKHRSDLSLKTLAFSTSPSGLTCERPAVRLGIIICDSPDHAPVDA